MAEPGSPILGGTEQARRRLSRKASALIAAVALVTVAAALLVTANVFAASGPTMPKAVQVENQEVTMVDDVVSSACFSFAVPDIADYELNPNAGACTASIRWVRGDSLSEIAVVGQTGDHTVQEHVAQMEEALTVAGVPPSVSVETINGRDVPVAQGLDSYGLPVTVYIVPLSGTNFVYEDTRIDSIMIHGKTGDPTMTKALSELVESLEIPAG